MARTPAAISWLVTHPFLLVPFLFYGYTCATAITFGDTALHVSRIHDASFSTHVNGHPIMIAWGWLFSLLPLDSPAHAANLVSAAFGALAICVFYFCILRLHRSRLVATLSASLLMVNHSMWWHSTIIEPYAFNALFTVIALALFVRMAQETDGREQQRPLRGLFFVGGLAVLSHIQMGFLCVGAAASLVTSMVLTLRQARSDWTRVTPGASTSDAALSGDASRDPSGDAPRDPSGDAEPNAWPTVWRDVAASAGWFLVGFLPWLVLFVIDWTRYASFGEAVKMAFVGHFADLILRGSLADAISDLARLTATAYPSPFLICVLAGVFLLFRNWRRSPVPLVGLATFFAVTTVFFMFYETWDKFAFLLPSWCILVFAGSFSIRWIVERLTVMSGSRRRVFSALALGGYALSLFLPVYVYGHMAGWASEGLLRHRFHDRPNSLYRVGTFWWNPNKRGYSDVEDYANGLFAALPENAVLIDEAGRTFHTMTLYFQRLLAKRRDVMIVQFNTDGIPGWGFTENELATTLVSAALANRDLFMDPGSPAYHAMLRTFRHEPGIRFQPFRLDASRSIARLVLRKETDGSDLRRIAANSGFREVPAESLQSVYEPVPGDLTLALNVDDLIQERVRSGTAWRHGDQLHVVATHDRAEISIVVTSTEVQSGMLEVGYTTAPDYGNVALLVNHAQAGAVENLYSASTGVLVRQRPEVDFQEGVNVITFRVRGKDDLSAGHSFGLDWIAFRPHGNE